MYCSIVEAMAASLFTRYLGASFAQHLEKSGFFFVFEFKRTLDIRLL
jgi:hypothetical protein